ncbi:MAG: tetratricopeptide repeat protein [Saprospiraceae bacterium]
MSRIIAHGQGFVFIDDFEVLLEDPNLYVAFNQRRGKMARLPISLIAFLPPGERLVKTCIERLPDWWSVLSFLAELHPEAPAIADSLALPTNAWQQPAYSTLGGTTHPERSEEIQRLKERIDALDITPENAPLLNRLYPQLLELYKTTGLYSLGYQAADHWLKAAIALGGEQNDPENYALILDRLGTFEQHLGHYHRAERLMKRSLAITMQLYDADHPNVAVSQSNLATVYLDLGDFARAKDIFEAALASYLKNFGADHPNVAVTRSNLASVYLNFGDYARARELLEAALASDIRNFGSDHPNVSVRQSNLGSIYFYLGDLARARELLKAALASDLKNFGADHPNVAVRQSNLAKVYFDLGDFARARELLEAALASFLNNFGADHPNVAVIQTNLGEVLLNEGKQQEAGQLFAAAYELSRKALGESHPKR